MCKLAKYIVSVAVLALPLICFGQNHLDSLYQKWQNQNLADSLRAEALESYIYDGPFRDNPDSAAVLSKTLFDFYQSIGDKQGMVDALYLKGYISFRMGKYNDALTNYDKGLKLAENIGDSIGAADILLKTGYVYHDNEDYLKAIAYYERSLKLYEKLDDLIGKGNIYNEYGSIYRSRGDFEKSLEYYLQSVQINDSLGDEEDNGAVYNNIGNLYLDEQKFDTALQYYNKSLDIEEKNNDQLGIAAALGGIGTTLMDMGDYDKALEILQRSLRTSEAVNDVQGGIATRLNIADIYLEKKEYSKALRTFNKSLEKAKSIGDLGNQEYAYQGLYESYRAMGNSLQALENYENMLAISDSLKTEETAIKLQQMEFAKKVVADSLLQVEKDLKVQMKHQEEVRRKDKNRNLAIGAGFLFLLLAIGFYSRWRYVRKSRAIIKKEKDRSENLLLNILPAEIAEELKEKGEAKARDFEMVSILFTDFKDFTEQSAKVSATALIDEINYCFKNFDLICEKYRVEKIKTIGDAYMAAGGLPIPSEDAAEKTVLAALEMQSFMQSRFREKNQKNELTFEMRVGIHTGPVVAGIVGVKKFQYDIWGDTVNTASRIETNGEVGKVNISDDTYKILKNNSKFSFQHRGKIQAKGKGQIDMWFVDFA